MIISLMWLNENENEIEILPEMMMRLEVGTWGCIRERNFLKFGAQ